MIVIPMAGLSSRFRNAGYKIPKYQLSLKGETVFEKSLKSFYRYFKDDEFVFITRKELKAKDFIKEKATLLGIDNFKIHELEEVTLGQADTVHRGLLNCEEQELFIFNIDTFLLDFKKPGWLKQCDGYLEVFIGEGEHWSFVEAGANNNVLRTTEKLRISNHCSNGLYYFKSIRLFNSLIDRYKKEFDSHENEMYIAPLYNFLIADGGVIKYKLVKSKDILFCGTPSEYEHLLSE